MKRNKNKSNQVGPGQRQLRVGEQLRHGLADILRRGSFRDPALANAHSLTVTAVDISPDLKNATAYIIPLGSEKNDAPIEELNHASGYFRSELAKQLTLRYMPRIIFKIDHSFGAGNRIEEILRDERVQRDLKKGHEESSTEDTFDENG